MELNTWYVVEYRQGESVWYQVERVTKFMWWKDKETLSEGWGILFITTDIDEAREKRDKLNNLNNKIYIKVLEE